MGAKLNQYLFFIIFQNMESAPKKIRLDILRQFLEWERLRPTGIIRNTLPPTNQNISIFKKVKTLFKNQIEFGKDIAYAFNDKSVTHVLAVARTQSGKTGSMLSSIYYSYLHSHIRSVFVITGISDKYWVEQTRERMPSNVGVYHRNHLLDLARQISKLSNVMILVDECHVACNDGQTLQKFWHEAGLSTPADFYNRDVRVVLVSATPVYNSIIFDKNTYGHTSLEMPIPDSYVSVEKLQDAGVLHQAFDTCGWDKRINAVDPNVPTNIRKHMEHLILDYEQPRWHIVRTHNGFKHDITIQNFKKAFDKYDFEFISEMEVDGDFTRLFEKKPKKHSFIFIKEKIRCAKTIHKHFIGIIVDRFNINNFYHVVAQGLLGRMTGFYYIHKQHIFTHLNAIDI